MKRAVFLFVLLSLFVAGSALAQATEPASGVPQAGWNEIPVPTGICARGTAYSFFVHPGNPEKLLIYFEGGGSCWNAQTCKVGGPFTDSVLTSAANLDYGIFNFDNPLNPVADYSVIYVSYCTGDLHSGSTTQTYTLNGSSFEIHYNGFNNAQAVLAWTYAHYPNPTNVIVTGSSAGAGGAIFNAPYILSHYPNARAAVFGDSLASVRAPGFSGPTVWKMADNLYTGSRYVAALGTSDVTANLWTAAAQTFPTVAFGEYSTYSDATQTGYYVLEGGLAADWSPLMEAKIAALDPLSNFHSYIAGGSIHTILGRPLFYTLRVNGVWFYAWFATLLKGGGAPNASVGNTPIAALSDVNCSACQTAAATTTPTSTPAG